MPPDPFTKAEVDYLVAASKFIKEIPRPQFMTPGMRTGSKIQVQVFRKSDLKPIKGLVVMAKAHQAPAGLPPPTPSSVLEWYGRRIRGINYELWHDNPDGSSVRGWHEHIWSPKEHDAHVVKARPEPAKRDLLGILNWGLEKWNIEVLREQMELL